MDTDEHIRLWPQSQDAMDSSSRSHSRDNQQHRGFELRSPLRNVSNQNDISDTTTQFSYESVGHDDLNKITNVRTSKKRASTTTIAVSVFHAILPLAICALYIVIVFDYILRSAVNGVVPRHTVDPRTVFFLWLIASIFFLEWAKTSLAWIESAIILNHPRLAPANPGQLLWHLDRGWSSLATWWRIVCYSYRRLRSRHTTSEDHKFHRPGRLWWLFAFVYLLFAVAIPLAGLSMDPDEASRISNEPVTITGVNETTFDIRTSVAVASFARNNWRTGRITTPDDPAVFYAPEATKNASATFFEDVAQSIYEHDLLMPGNQTGVRQIDFFSGPSVAARVNGRVWGVQTIVECSAVRIDDHSDRGMQLINSTTPTNWSGMAYSESSEYWDEDFAGLEPIFAYSSPNSFGSNFSYVVASDRAVDGTGSGDYIVYPNSNETGSAITGSFEMVLWQSIATNYQPDPTYRNMSTHPLVTTFPSDTGDFLGYGVRCDVTSDVGYATLDAAHHTYSNFEHLAGEYGSVSVTDLSTAGVPLFQWPGVYAIQSLVFQGISTVALSYMGPPACSSASSDITCNGYYGANAATGAVPAVADLGTYGRALQLPTISPERMTLAMYKLFGETAAAMMTIGPGNWTSNDLHALEPANDLVEGRIDWRAVLVLLCLWTLLAVAIQIPFLTETRWDESLEAFAVKTYGINWKDGLTTH